MFYEKADLQSAEIFTGKHLCWSIFLMKLQAFRPVTLLKRLQHSLFNKSIRIDD